MTVLNDLRKLLHPYYFTNILLSLSFVVSKLTPLVCRFVFPNDECELSIWEAEVVFFLLVIVAFRTRKSGSRTMLNYITTAATYAKACNIILWFSADPVKGIAYLVLVTLHFLVIGEPVYRGPEHVTYFRANGLDEELARDRHVTWLICFYTSWSPLCGSLAPVFAKLSAEYTLENLKFGKVDVGMYPEVAKKHHINDTSFSLQIPTISLFKDGKDTMRRPCLDERGKFHKFYFTEDNIRAAFDLNNLHLECKKPLASKKVKSVTHAKAE